MTAILTIFGIAFYAVVGLVVALTILKVHPKFYEPSVYGDMDSGCWFIATWLLWPVMSLFALGMFLTKYVDSAIEKADKR